MCVYIIIMLVSATYNGNFLNFRYIINTINNYPHREV